jgi:hypothetical protein
MCPPKVRKLNRAATVMERSTSEKIERRTSNTERRTLNKKILNFELCFLALHFKF